MRDTVTTIILVVLGLLAIGSAGLTERIEFLGFATVLLGAGFVHHAFQVWQLHEEDREADKLERLREINRQLGEG